MPQMPEGQQLRQVRRFNRTVTQRIGVLSADYLGSGRALGEARLLFEIGRDGATVRELRARLALDSGYLSRMLRALEREKLVSSARDAGDARVRRVRLTPKGRKEWARLDAASEDLAAAVLAPLGSTQRSRLLAAMAEVERFLHAAAVTLDVADPAGAEAQCCFKAYFGELAQRFEEGFDPARSVSAAPQELVPPQGWLLIAHLDGAPVGCGALKIHRELPEGFGEIKRMWVAPAARGLGVAQRLLESLEARAADAGVSRVRLDTHRTLAEARALYLRNGYAEISPYNDNPYAHHWFEKRIRGARPRPPASGQIDQQPEQRAAQQIDQRGGTRRVIRRCAE